MIIAVGLVGKFCSACQTRIIITIIRLAVVKVARVVRVRTNLVGVQEGAWAGQGLTNLIVVGAAQLVSHHLR